MIVGFSPTMTETLRDYVRRVRSEKNLSTGDVQARSLNAISDAYVSQIDELARRYVTGAKAAAWRAH